MAKEKEQKTERQLLVEQLLDQIDFHGLSQEDIFGQDGIIKDLTKRVVERALNAEMDHHLGYEKHSKAGDNSGDSRNGTSKKTIIADNREIEIDVPRDRNGSFEPIDMFYNRKWIGVSIDEFVRILDDYIHWYNEKRIKQSLGGLSPLDYRRKMGLTA